MKLYSLILLQFLSNCTFDLSAHCPCFKYQRMGRTSCQIQFRSNEKYDLNKWTDTLKCDSIQSISFMYFDSIPIVFKRFRNVKKINLIGTPSIGLDYFPNLKELEVEELELTIPDTCNWPSRLEILKTNKTKIVGLRSFTILPRLYELNMSFSGFDSIPNDLHKLEQLKYLSFGGHTFGYIDLRNFDFNKFKQLEYFEIVCWFDKVKGLPMGLNSNVCTRINYKNMSLANQSKLQKIHCQ